MITTHMRGYLIKTGNTSCRIALPVNLRWNEDDPAAVSMTFQAEDEHPSTWLVGYDLLVEAMTCTTPTGEGDMQFRRDENVDVLFVCVKSPDGHADIALPLAPVEDFLDQSQSDVDLAQGAIPAQVDELLEEILGGQ